MQSQIIINIGCLANVRNESHILRGKELSELPCIYNAYLIIKDGMIAGYGEMKNIEQATSNIQPRTSNFQL